MDQAVERIRPCWGIRLAPHLLRSRAMVPASTIPVALFFSSFAPGGTEHQMIQLARRLDRRRFQVHAACFHRSGQWLSRIEDCATSVAEFPITSFHGAD